MNDQASFFDQLLEQPRFAKQESGYKELLEAFFREGLQKSGEIEQSRILKSIGAIALAKADYDADDLHVSTELTDMSIAFFQEMGMFAASSRGILPVANKADQIRKWDRGDLFRDVAGERVTGEEAPHASLGKSTVSYTCKRKAIRHDLDDEMLANDKVGDPRLRATRTVTQWMIIQSEGLWATAIFAASKWTGDQTGVDAGPGANQFLRWNVAGSLPQKDVSDGAVRLHERTGVWPNSFYLQPHVLQELLIHADIKDAFKHTTAGGIPTLQALAQAVFALGVVPAAQVPSVLIVGGVKNTAAKGATASFSYIGGKHALLAYVDPNPSLLEPTGLVVPAWESFDQGTNNLGVRIKTFEIEHRAIVEAVEGEIFRDYVITEADLGQMFVTAVA